jgi:flagellar biosynthesis/type III secretory pathway protein FliH
MSNDRPAIRLTRALRAVRASVLPAQALRQPYAETGQLEDLRRRLATEQECSSQARGELARQEARLAERLQALDEQSARLAALIASVERQRQELLESNEEEIVSFSLSITEKVLQCEIENGRYRIGEIVAAALRAVRDKGVVAVRVNPRDLEAARLALGAMSGAPEAGRFSAVADESVSPASCCIETDSGKVFSEIPERLKRIEQNLMGRPKDGTYT